MRLDKWDDRVSDLLIGLESFIIESSYNIDYYPEESNRRILNTISDIDSAIFLNYQKEVFAGFAIVTRDRDFHYQYFGYLTKFYVMPACRGTRAGRELLQEVVDWFDTHDCHYSFATSTALIGQNKAFENLLAKFGYIQSGTAMVRSP